MPKFKRRQERGGTAAGLASLNEVPLLNEIIIESDTGKMKVGDGATAYNLLPYFAGAGGGGGGGSEPTDGNKGDISVTGTGTNWQINADAVTNVELANMATKTYKGRTSAGTGNPEDISLTALKADLSLPTDTQDSINTLTADKQDVLISGSNIKTINSTSILGSGNIAISGGGLSDGDKGDITVSGTGATWTVDNDVVTYAKMQNVSAASKLLGRGDSGSGDPQEITLGTGLSMTGTTLSSSGGGSTIETLIASSADLDALITTATANPSNRYHAVLSTTTPVSTAKTVPSNVFIKSLNGAKFTKSGSGTIAFQGVGLTEPESTVPLFSGFAAGDVTWTGSVWPMRISSEIIDTGNTSLSDRVAWLQAAFGTSKRNTFVLYPRTMTVMTIVQGHNLFFTDGDYPNTKGAGSFAAFFFYGDGADVSGSWGARLHEGVGVNSCSIFDCQDGSSNIHIHNLWFEGEAASGSSGSPTASLGNCKHGSIRHCMFNQTHGYVTMGGAGNFGDHGEWQDISYNKFVMSYTQVVGVINARNWAVIGNQFDQTYTSSTVNGYAVIDAEPNITLDKMENGLIAFNQIDFTNAAASFSYGIGVQAATCAGAKNIAIHKNRIIGRIPQADTTTPYVGLINGIFGHGLDNCVITDNDIQGANSEGVNLINGRNCKISGNIATGGRAGSGDAILLYGFSDSWIKDNHCVNNWTPWTQATGIGEREMTARGVASGSTISVSDTIVRVYDFWLGLTINYNAADYVIATTDFATESFTTTVPVGTVAAAVVASATDVDATGNKIIKTAHGFNDGCILLYFAGTAAIGGITDQGFYYVVNKTANDFQLSLTAGGSAIDLTSTGTGTQTFTPCLKTKFSSNEYSGNRTPTGYALEPTGTSQILSTLAPPRNISDADATATTGDTLLVYTSLTDARSVNLPDASLCKGLEIAVKDGAGTAAANYITWDPYGAQTVDGVATKVAVSANYGISRVKSTGAGWITVSSAGGATNPREGTVTLVAGVATVSDASITADTRIFVQRNADGGTIGASYSVTRSVGASFTVTAKKSDGTTETADTSTMAYWMVEPAATGGGGSATNVALLSAGSTASASTTATNFSPDAAFNGVRHPNNQWGSAGTYATGNGFASGVNPSVTPQWLEIDFGATRTITEVDVFTLADAITYNTDPTLADTFTLYGIVDYKVQSWNGSSWVDQVTVTGNNKVWRQHTGLGVTTTKMRLYMTLAQGGDTRIVEFECWGT